MKSVHRRRKSRFGSLLRVLAALTEVGKRPKRTCVLKWVALGFLVVASAVAFLQAGHFLEAPGQAPEKADLIAALGGNAGNRVQKAAQ